MKVGHVIGAVCLLGTGCTGSHGAIQKNRAAVLTTNGTYEFYAGKGIGNLLDKGTFLPEESQTPFMRLTVPVEFVESALATPQHVKTVSFEVPDPSIEVAVHGTNRDTGKLETLYYHPDDPWISGFAQVGLDSDNFTMGLFEVIHWQKETSGTMPGVFGHSIHTTGLLADDNMPSLKFANDLNAGPLPETWK